MKIILSVCFYLLSMVPGAHSMVADSSRTGMNGIYAEVYFVRHDFSSGFASINYERVLGKKNRAHLRAGVYPDFESTISFPATITWITGPFANHHFEWGAGAVFRIEHFVDPYVLVQSREWFYDVPAIMLPLMYRYHSNAGWLFRAGFNVFVSWPTLPSPSISIGYRF